MRVAFGDFNAPKRLRSDSSISARKTPKVIVRGLFASCTHALAQSVRPGGRLNLPAGRPDGILIASNIREMPAMDSRHVIEPHKGDKRYVRRDEQGHFTVPKGQGDHGEEKQN